MDPQASNFKRPGNTTGHFAADRDRAPTSRGEQASVDEEYGPEKPAFTRLLYYWILLLPLILFLLINILALWTQVPTASGAVQGAAFSRGTDTFLYGLPLAILAGVLIGATRKHVRRRQEYKAFLAAHPEAAIMEEPDDDEPDEDAPDPKFFADPDSPNAPR